MMTRNPRRTPAQWAQLVADYDQSGLSKSRYCRQNSIGVSTLDNWRRRISNTASSQSKSGFVELTGERDVAQVTLQAENGVSLLCPVSMGIDAIAALSKAIGDEH